MFQVVMVRFVEMDDMEGGSCLNDNNSKLFLYI